MAECLAQRLLPGGWTAKPIGELSLSDPGIDDFRNEILWSPEQAHIA